jgi:hypothetical protein
MRWDPNTGKFVPGGGMGTDGTGIDLSGLADLVNSGMFPGFNFGDLGNYLGTNTGGGMTFDPATGTFRQPGSQTTTTPPGTDTTGGDQFKFDPNNYQFNPFVDGFDMNSLPGYQQNQNPYMGQDMPVGNLTGIDQFADPNYSTGMQFDMSQLMQPGKGPDIGSPMYGGDIQPFQYDFSGLGQMSGMGDMGGYGQQFQGFQPLSTDFGSTYQAPAMQTPTFDYSAYNPQQFDLGSMGYGLGSLPAISSTYQAPTVQTPTFDTSAFQMPAYQAPMMTGGDMGMSNVATAPQFGFGNSDVLYGRSSFDMGGGEGNIFGFAGGGSVQRAAAGKLITGNGDGMSDDIRANIDGNQEARLADGEFVIPADVVSHLGNGSTDAGADQLHAMMDRIRKARTGRSKQAPEIDPGEYMPA